MQVKIKVFYKLILSFWLCVVSDAQSTQNKKFAYLCNISRKIWEMKLIFCLQINMKIFYKLIVSLWVCVAARQAQITQNDKFVVSFQCLKKKVSDKVDFLHADKHEIFLQVDSALWASKFCTRWYYHYWWAWSNILRVFEATSLQYLYSISKELGMEFIFCMQINIKVSTSWHYRSWWK